MFDKGSNQVNVSNVRGPTASELYLWQLQINIRRRLLFISTNIINYIVRKPKDSCPKIVKIAPFQCVLSPRPPVEQ